MPHKFLPGSPVSECKKEDFDPVQLVKGTKIEMEHTSDRKIAEEIAMAHLLEHKDYYKELVKMEDKLEKREGASVYPLGDGNGTTDSQPDKTGDVNDNTDTLGRIPKSEEHQHESLHSRDPYEDEENRKGFGDDDNDSIARPSGVGTMETYSSWDAFCPEVEQLNSGVAYNHFIKNCWNIIEAFMCVGASRQSTYTGIRRTYPNVFEYKPWAHKIASRFLDIYFGTHKRIASSLLVNYGKMVEYLQDCVVKGLDQHESENMLYDRYSNMYDSYGEDFERISSICIDYVYGPRLATQKTLCDGKFLTYVWDKNICAKIDHVEYGKDNSYVYVVSNCNFPSNIPVNRFIIHAKPYILDSKSIESMIKLNKETKILLETDGRGI